MDLNNKKGAANVAPFELPSAHGLPNEQTNSDTNDAPENPIKQPFAVAFLNSLLNSPLVKTVQFKVVETIGGIGRCVHEENLLLQLLI